MAETPRNDYFIGQLVRVYTLSPFSVNGTPTDPTTVTVKVKAPDGSLTTAAFGSSAIVKDSVGTYHYDVDATLPGTYAYAWVGTGVCKTAAEHEFYVKPSQVA